MFCFVLAKIIFKKWLVIDLQQGEVNFNSKINVLIRLSVIKESDSGLSWYVRDPWGGGDQGR